MHDFPVLVPSHVETAGVAPAPVERRLVWRMCSTGGEVGHERPRGCDRLLLADPADTLVSEIARELIALVRPLGWLDRLGVADERRIELISLAADEAVEVIEALVGGPV